MFRITLYCTRNSSKRAFILYSPGKRLVLKFGGICGIAAAASLVLGFLVGGEIAATIAGTTQSNGESAGTLQTYGEPLENLLVILDKAAPFHVASRIILFVGSLLSIPMLLALHFIIWDRKTRNRFLSLTGLVLGIAAASSFAISHAVTGPLSLDIANRYSQASTDAERGEIVAAAEELDASIGLTTLDNIFIAIGLTLISAVFLSFGLAMVKARLFQRWLGWSSIVVGILSIAGFIAGSLTGLGGVALAPAAIFGMAWLILVGYNVHRMSKVMHYTRP